MTPLRALVAVLWFVILSAGSYMWTTYTAQRVVRVVRPPVATSSVLDEVVNGVTQLEPPARTDDWAEPHVDLNGNEIDDAVGDYRIDRRGEQYERHAPDVALPRLAAPRL